MSVVLVGHVRPSWQSVPCHAAIPTVAYERAHCIRWADRAAEFFRVVEAAGTTTDEGSDVASRGADWDAICLQEVTPRFLDLLCQRSWWRKRRITSQTVASCV